MLWNEGSHCVSSGNRKGRKFEKTAKGDVNGEQTQGTF